MHVFISFEEENEFHMKPAALLCDCSRFGNGKQTNREEKNKSLLNSVGKFSRFGRSQQLLPETINHPGGE